MRNSEDRHVNRGHLIRVTDDAWNSAGDRARNEGLPGLTILIEGWLLAYGRGELDAVTILEDRART